MDTRSGKSASPATPWVVLSRSMRSVSCTGDLASSLANYDMHTYRSNSYPATSCHSPTASSLDKADNLQWTKPRIPNLPIEIIAEIMDHIGDWELSKSVGLPTSLAPPLEWERATTTDEAILTGNLTNVQNALSTAHRPFTRVGAHLALRFAFVNILEYLLKHHRNNFNKEFEQFPQFFNLAEPLFIEISEMSFILFQKRIIKAYECIQADCVLGRPAL